MKTKDLLLIGMIAGTFSACSNQPVEPSSDVASPGAGMVIVKFSNSQQLKNVIASHRIVNYDGTDGYFVYDTTGGVGLNIAKDADSQFTFTAGEHDAFFDSTMNLPGTSPYIPLAKDYYLVDWKWQMLLPISATCNAPQPDGNDLRDMADNHCFLTDMPWEDLQTVCQRWDNPLDLSRVQIDEIRRVGFVSIDKYSGKAIGDQALYNDGITPVAVMICINNPDLFPDANYVSLIAQYDSIQNLYREELIRIINNNKLDQICVKK